MNLLRTRIDLDAIAHNTRLVKDLVAPAELMAVVKADAYGHGADHVVKVMAEHGADRFGVATTAEAVALTEHTELPVLAWIWSADEDLAEPLSHGIELGVPSLAHAHALIDAAIPARVAVMADTGMHRSGIDEAHWEEAFTLLRDAEHLTVTGVFSHLACADEPHDPFTDVQAEGFRRAIALGRKLGLELPRNHLANSPATLTRPDLYFDQVRPGLILYGLDPLPGDHGLKPAMTWAADVVVVKPIKAGEGTSYSLSWRAKQDGYLAVIHCGYADGLPRRVQGALEVGIGGKRYPQVGRVCMDQIIVDLGENPYGVAEGDEAVLFGPGGMSATELADMLGTINYEVACLPKGRTVRTYEGGL